jgi:hypothetical protein
MENNKKQTAVEWLVEQLKEYDFADIKNDKNYMIKIPAWILNEKEEQANAMEKEQIVDAYDDGLFDGTMDDVNDRIYKQYYNETFNNESKNKN